MAQGTDYSGDKQGLLQEGIENNVFKNELQAVDGDDNQEALKNLAETFWAPEDGKSYARMNGQWVEVEGFPEAPVDGKEYARQNEGWVEVSGFLEWKYTSDQDSVTVGPKKGYTYTGNSDSSWSLPDPLGSENGQYIGVKNSSDYSLAINKNNGYFFQKLNPGDSFIFSFEGESNEWQIVSDYRAPEPIDVSQAIFYVDGNLTTTGNGSFLAPFMTLEEARDSVIGTGTNGAPQFLNSRIEVLGGVFSISSGDNFWINYCLYNFAEGVQINYSGAGYFIDTQIFDTATEGDAEFYITGSLYFVSDSSNSGFLKAWQFAANALKNSHNITINLSRLETTVNRPSSPLIYSGNDNNNNIGNTGGYNRVAINVSEAIWVREDGLSPSVAMIDNLGALNLTAPQIRSSSYSSHPNGSSRIKINGCWDFSLNDAEVNGGNVDSYIRVEGDCYSVFFNNVSFGAAVILQDGAVSLGFDYSYSTRGYTLGQSVDSGVRFSNCKTISSTAGAFFVQNSTGIDARVDFVDCSTTVDIDPTNIIECQYYNNGVVNFLTRVNLFAGVITYTNVPTSAPSRTGAVWNNSGVLTLV